MGFETHLLTLVLLALERPTVCAYACVCFFLGGGHLQQQHTARLGQFGPSLAPQRKTRMQASTAMLTALHLTTVATALATVTMMVASAAGEANTRARTPHMASLHLSTSHHHHHHHYRRRRHRCLTVASPSQRKRPVLIGQTPRPR